MPRLRPLPSGPMQRRETAIGPVYTATVYIDEATKALLDEVRALDRAIHPNWPQYDDTEELSWMLLLRIEQRVKRLRELAAARDASAEGRVS